MIDWNVFWELLFFASITTLTPGLNNVLTFLYVIYFGAKKAIVFRLGVLAGFPVQCVLVVVGLQPVFAYFPDTMFYLNLVGAVLMLYIAYKIAFSLPDFDKARDSLKPIGFWGAILLQFVNGKAWSMAFIGASLYTTQTESLFVQANTIYWGFFLPNIVLSLPWILLPFYARNWLQNSRRLGKINLLFGAVIAYSAVAGFF